MAVYDDQDKKTEIGDEHMRRITGISDKEEAGMDKSAHAGAAEDKSKNEAGTEGTKVKSAEESAADTIGKGFTSDDSGGSFVARIRGGLTRKRIIGGGTIGLVIALIFGGLSFSSGPFQFIHIAQLLQQYHFGSQEDVGDDRMMKIGRYITNKGSERTRLGILGNQYADKIEAKLNKSGIESSYNRLGYLDGYVIDPTTVPKDSEPGKIVENNNPTDAEAALSKRYNTTVTYDAGKNVFHIDAEGLNYRDSKVLVRSVLQDAHYTKMSASLKARIMGKRAGITWHPIKKLDKALLEAIDKRLPTWQKENQDRINNGETDEITTATQQTDANNDGKPDPVGEESTHTKSEADQVITDSSAASDELATGAPASSDGVFTKLSTSTSVKLAGGATAAIGIVCVVKGISDNIDVIQHKQVTLPLMRMGMQAVTLGNQVMSGKDMNLQELGFFAKQLNGTDSPTGSKAGWAAARSLQAEAGEPLTGPDIRDEAKLNPGGNIVSQFINSIPGVGGVCKAANSIVGQAVSFGIDVLSGPISAITGAAFGQFLAPKLVDGLSRWLAGNPIDVNVAGADFGNYINYGVRLAANDSNIAAGGIKLSNQQATALKADQVESQQSQMAQKSFADRMFNPYDSGSLVSKVIDKQDPNVHSSLSNTASAILSFKGIVSSLPKMLSSMLVSNRVRAATDTSYDYGFPQYGFSIDDLDNPAVRNPFDNANKVADILNGGNGDAMISRVKNCFGITLSKQGDITSPQDVPTYKNIDDSGSNCNDGSQDWLRVRFYILDTETMEATTCYEGDETSCRNVGFGGPAPTQQTPGGGVLPSGTAQDLAKQIMDSGKVTFNDTRYKQQVEDIANGVQGCYLDPVLLQVLAAMTQTHSFTLSSLNRQCTNTVIGAGKNSLHWKGKAADIAVVDGKALTGGDADRPLMHELTGLLPDGSEMGQVSCSSIPINPIHNVRLFDDTCNHVHIGVPE